MKRVDMTESWKCWSKVMLNLLWKVEVSSLHMPFKKRLSNDVEYIQIGFDCKVRERPMLERQLSFQNSNSFASFIIKLFANPTLQSESPKKEACKVHSRFKPFYSQNPQLDDTETLESFTKLQLVLMTILILSGGRLFLRFRNFPFSTRFILQLDRSSLQSTERRLWPP